MVGSVFIRIRFEQDCEVLNMYDKINCSFFSGQFGKTSKSPLKGDKKCENIRVTKQTMCLRRFDL